MIITIPRSDLARGLTLAARIGPRKPTLPILSHVLLRGNKHALTLSATDLNVSLTAEIQCHVDQPGAIAVNAADLQRFVANAAGDEVSIKVDGSAWAEVRCGKARYRLAGMSDRDFPKVPNGDGDAVEVDATKLCAAFDAVGYAVSLDESRGAVCGILIEPDAMAATDGYRLAVVKHALGIQRPPVVLSARGAQEFAKLLGDHETCRVAIGKRMSVSAGGVTISAGLLDFVFPPYRQVIPDKHKATALVDRDQLLAAIKRVSPLASETRGITVRSADTGLVLRAEYDGSEISDEVTCEVTGTIAFGVHAKYLSEAVSHMAGDTVTLRCGGELDPIVIQDNDDLAVVMPMRM